MGLKMYLGHEAVAELKPMRPILKSDVIQLLTALASENDNWLSPDEIKINELIWKNAAHKIFEPEKHRIYSAYSIARKWGLIERNDALIPKRYRLNKDRLNFIYGCIREWEMFTAPGRRAGLRYSMHFFRIYKEQLLLEV